jgi:hypothetical protein
MPKSNKLERARPFNEILPEILMLGGLLETTPLSDKEDPAVMMDVSPAVRKIYDYIKVRVNDDVCITEDQQKVFVEDVKRLAESGAEDDIGALQRFVTLINSYRFECVNCLAGNCPKRDPDFPSRQ